MPFTQFAQRFVNLFAQGDGDSADTVANGAVGEFLTNLKGTDMSNVVNLAARKAAGDTEVAFLALIEKDIEKRPESVRPLSKSLLDRVTKLEVLAKANQDAERLEC